MKFLKSIGYIIKSFLVFLLLAFLVSLFSFKYIEPLAYSFYVGKVTKNFNISSEDIVLVSIDDESIAYHRWPWPREMYGEILNYFNSYAKTKVIGFDAIIPSLDKDNPESDKKFFDAVNKTNNLVVGFNSVTGAKLPKNNEEYIEKFDNKFFNIKYKDFTSDTYEFFKGIQEFPGPYFNAVKHVGAVYTPVNKYNTVIKMSQIISINGKYYPSLALSMYLYMNNVQEIILNNNNISIEKTHLIIPAKLDDTAGIWENNLKYYNNYDNTEYTHKVYHASDIIKSYQNIQKGLKPIIDPKEFDGKIVFIGSYPKTSEISLMDVQKTPIQGRHPGTDIQATNLDNLLNNNFMYETSLWLNILLILFIALITFIILSKLPILKAILLVTILAISLLIIGIFFYKNGYSIYVITPIIIQIITMIFGYSYKFIVEGKNKEKIKQAMGKYLSQDVMQNVVQNIDEIKLGGKRAIVTVLFADIRGFTSMSEKMSAEDVSKILNEYFTEIEPIITRYNGVINKFIGDAVMAIFGEPMQDLNHPINAVYCAYDMLKKVKELQERWLFEGKPKIEIGIGINTGECFVGNIGSEKRLEYTVIGDTVNLASRIEHYNKVYHTNLLVSSSTYSYISSIADVIKISEVTIRGKAKKMDIYEVLRINDKIWKS